MHISKRLGLAGVFRLSCLLVIGLTLHPRAAAAQGGLTNGGSHAGSISAPGKIDTWTFVAAKGDAILLKIGEVAPSATGLQFFPWIRLNDPAGASVGSAFGALAAEISLTAPQSGTYTVLVSDGSGSGAAIGNYLLHLVKAPGTFVVSDEGGPLTNGGNHSGHIHVGDLDPWSFEAAQNESIVIKIGEVEPSETGLQFFPWIRLFGPTGAQIGSAFSSLAAEIAITAPLTGTYTVVVTDGGGGGGAATGDYLLHLVKALGTINVPDHDEGGPLTNGGNHAGHIHVGDLDPWTFQAAQNESIVLKIGEVEPSETGLQFFPWIRLFGPTGAQIGSAFSSLAAEIAITAPLTGTYTVVVTDGGGGGGAATGDYLLHLVKALGTINVPDHDEGGPLTSGGNHAGHIHVGDLDPWTFQAAKNDFVVLKIGEVAPSETGLQFFPWIRLFGPTGAEIGSAFSSLAAEIAVTAPLSGSYTVVVTDGGGGGGAAIGNYLLHFVKVPGGSVVPSGDQGGALTSSVAANGMIHVGDLDPWTLTSKQGAAISISIGELLPSGPDPGFFPWIRLIGPTGVQVGSAFGALTAQINITAPLTGTYTVIVSDGSGGGGAAQGNYRLTAAFSPLPLPPTTRRPDFEGDGKADISIYRPTTGEWFVRYSSAKYNTAAVLRWGGTPGDIPLVADFDGDEKADLTIFRPSTGEWFIAFSSTGYSTAKVYQWGERGDVPLATDFDGDGLADLAIYRPTLGTWWIRYSSTGYNPSSMSLFQWGEPGDVPVAGDFDGDGKTDLTIWRPSVGGWYVSFSSSNFSTGSFYQWGVNGDRPLAVDIDGDRKTDLTVFRPSTGEWFVRYSSQGFNTGTIGYFQWGEPGDIPVVADFDGDGRSDVAVYRPKTGGWFVLSSSKGYSAGAGDFYQWGGSGDTPLPTP